MAHALTSIVAGKRALRDAPQGLADQKVLIRPIRPDDEHLLSQFGHGLSRETRYQRFFSLRELAPEEFRHLSQLDDAREAAFVATTTIDGTAQIIGVARFAATEDRSVGDYAVVIADAWQHQGLGRELSERIIALATARGYRALSALVLSTNYGMQRLALRLGFELSRDASDPTVMNLLKPLQIVLH